MSLKVHTPASIAGAGMTAETAVQQGKYMVQTQEAAGQGAKVVELLLVLLKRKKLIIYICSMTALLSLGYSLVIPCFYAATAKVLPPQKDNVGLSSILGQMGSVATMAAGAAKGNDTELYVSLLKSRSVGVAVIERLNLSKVYQTRTFKETWEKLDKAVKVQAGKDGIITITAEDTNPKRAAILANTMVDELGKTMVRLNLSKASTEATFLEKRLEVVKRDLKAAEEEMRAFSKRKGIFLVETQAGATVTGIAALKREIAAKEVQLATVRASRTDENAEVLALQAAIKRLKQTVADAAGTSGGRDGIPAIGNVPDLGLEYTRKLRDLKAQEAIFEQLSKQYELAKLNQAKDSSSLQILDEAVVPEFKSRPKRTTLVLMSTFVAFICSIGLVFLLEYLERMPEEERNALAELRKESLSFR